LQKEPIDEDASLSLKQADIFLDAAQKQLFCLGNSERKQRAERIWAAKKAIHALQTKDSQKNSKRSDARALFEMLESALQTEPTSTAKPIMA